MSFVRQEIAGCPSALRPARSIVVDILCAASLGGEVRGSALTPPGAPLVPEPPQPVSVAPSAATEAIAPAHKKPNAIARPAPGTLVTISTPSQSPEPTSCASNSRSYLPDRQC